MIFHQAIWYWVKDLIFVDTLPLYRIHSYILQHLRYSVHLGNILSRTSSVSLRLLTPTRSAMLPRTTKRSVLVMAPLPWTSQMVKHSDALSKAEPRAVTQRKSRSSLQCTYLGLGGEIEVINVNYFEF